MKTIALIDNASGGHRDAFMRYFAKACLEINTRVICIYPNTTSIKEWINIHANPYISQITYIENTCTFIPFNGMRAFNEPIGITRYWKNIARFLKKVETDIQQKIDFVYFNWIDSQMANNIPPFVIDWVFPYKWSGLYFHPTVFRVNEKFLEKAINFRDIDNVFTAKNCIAVTLHDEGILERYQRRIKKPTILFPEIADITEPDTQLPLANRIRAKANGRIVVGTIGLEYHKGCYPLVKLCQQADASKFFFAFTGIFSETLLTYFPENEKNEVLDFMNHLPENAIWETGTLNEGAEYNAVFNSFDIIHLIYKNFYSSSNRLTKAANFHKFVLANNIGCVGDDVPKYDLGETADENNIEEHNQEIEILRNRILKHDFPYEQWKIYSEKHSTEILKEKFTELLKLV